MGEEDIRFDADINPTATDKIFHEPDPTPERKFTSKLTGGVVKVDESDDISLSDIER